MPGSLVGESPESTIQIPDSVHSQQNWSQIRIDLMDTVMKIEGYKYTLTVKDYFIKWFKLIP